MWILDTVILNDQNNEVPLQVEHMGEHYRWDDPDSVTRMVNGPLTVRPNLSAFHLDPATRRTDLVRQGYVYAMGLLASQAFRRALDGMRVQPHQAYPADVVFQAERFQYWWLHITAMLEGQIDYSASVFDVRRPGGGLSVAHLEDEPAVRRLCLDLVNTIEGGELRPRSIRFAPAAPALDLFALRLSHNVWFVSDRLAERLRQRRLTGFELRPADVVFAEG